MNNIITPSMKEVRRGMKQRKRRLAWAGIRNPLASILDRLTLTNSVIQALAAIGLAPLAAVAFA